MNFVMYFLRLLQIIAGNCKMREHEINMKDSLPIKPHRVPFHKRAKVNEIIEEMREQGVIEESVSPCFSEKEGWNDKILRRLSQAKCHY